MQPLNNRNGVSKSFARASLRFDEAIAAVQNGRNSFLLDLCHIFQLEALLQTVGQVRTQIEIGECVDREDFLFDSLFSGDTLNKKGQKPKTQLHSTRLVTSDDDEPKKQREPARQKSVESNKKSASRFTVGILALRPYHG